jgi:hypothetical protein
MPYTAPNRLNVGVQTPNVNVSDFVIRPMETLAGLDAGRRVASGMIDEVMLRPKQRAEELSQIAAAQAVRPAQVEEALSQIAAAQAVRPSAVNAAIADANAKVPEAAVRAQDAERTLDPDKEMKDAQAQVDALKNDLEIANAKLKEELTPKPGEVMTEEDIKKIKARHESSIGKTSKDLAQFQFRLQDATARRMATTNKNRTEAVKSSTELQGAQAAARYAPEQINFDIRKIDLANRAGVAAGEAGLITANQGLADIRALDTPEMAAVRQQLAEFGLTTPLLEAKAAQKRLELTLAGKAGTLPADAAAVKQFTDDWKIAPPAGATYDDLRGLAQKQINIEAAKPELVKLDAAVQGNSRLEAAADGFITMLGGNDPVTTGVLFNYAPPQFIDGVLAMFGNEGSIKREQLNAFTNAFVQQDLANYKGAISDYEGKTIRSGSPNIGKSNAANMALVFGALELSKRQKAQRDFMLEKTKDGAVSWNDASAQWGRYIENNPVFDRTAPDDSPAINRGRLTVGEWDAMQSGDLAKQQAVIIARKNALLKALASKQADKGSLPRGTIGAGGQLTGVPESAPFAVVGDSIMHNPVYWTLQSK